jgi:ABC-type nitrate/sulfonate/bicarbonate transport system substrate-binding protein
VAPSSFSVLDAKGHVRVIAQLWSMLPEFSPQAAFASTAAIKAKGDVLARTLAAYLKAFRYVAGPSSRSTYLQAAVKVAGETTTDATALYDFYQQHDYWARDLQLTAARVNYIQQLNVASGVQQKVLPFDQVADLSLAQKAVQLLS